MHLFDLPDPVDSFLTPLGSREITESRVFFLSCFLLFCFIFSASIVLPRPLKLALSSVLFNLSRARFPGAGCYLHRAFAFFAYLHLAFEEQYPKFFEFVGSFFQVECTLHLAYDLQNTHRDEDSTTCYIYGALFCLIRKMQRMFKDVQTPPRQCRSAPQGLRKLLPGVGARVGG